MSSDRKIEANRANAQSSTGPQTDEGKAASSQNARKHGLSAASIFIPPGREDEFKSLYTHFFDEIRPVGPLQAEYFEQLIHARWNLGLAREFHARALAEMDEKKIASAARYLGQFERAFAKAHKALKDEQTDLALRAIPENEPIADLPLTCRVQVIAHEATKLAQRRPPAERAGHRAAILHGIGHAFRPPVPEDPQGDTQNEATAIPEAA